MTYNISEDAGRFSIIEKVEGYTDITIEQTNSTNDNESKQLKMMFGLYPENKQTIVFH